MDSVDCLPQRGSVSSNPLTAWREWKGRGRRNLSLLPCFTDWAGMSNFIFSCPQTEICSISSVGSQAFRLTLNYITTFLGLQLAESSCGTSLPLLSFEPIPHDKSSYLYVHICSAYIYISIFYWFCFSRVPSLPRSNVNNDSASYLTERVCLAEFTPLQYLSSRGSENLRILCYTNESVLSTLLHYIIIQSNFTSRYHYMQDQGVYNWTGGTDMQT